MIATKRTPRLPLKYHGGKARLARRIIVLMPPARAFAEHFAGGMAVGLNLAPLPFHFANDSDPDLMNFWGRLQSSGESGLLDAIRTLSYSAETFQAAKQPERFDPDSRALAYLVVRRMSRGGLGKDFGWSDRTRGKTRPGGPFPGDRNAWETMVEYIPKIVARLAPIRLTCRAALESIREADAEFGPDIVHYCDPPYMHSTRTHRKAYAREMTPDQHAELLSLLLTVRGPVLLSGYRSPLYDAELSGWDRIEWERPNDSGQGKTKAKRIECIWSNRTLS
jgi:DNA adenine methylase